MFHGDVSGHHVRTKYPWMLLHLRTQLHLTETYMYAHRWNEIDFANVPSLCMDCQKHAFLNENHGGETKHHDDPERQVCCDKLLELLMNGGKLKGEQLFPHELVAQVWLVTQLYYMHHMLDAGANLYSFQVLADRSPSIAATKIITVMAGRAQRAYGRSRVAKKAVGDGRRPHRLRRI
jgi:hypothetical protein